MYIKSLKISFKDKEDDLNLLSTEIQTNEGTFKIDCSEKLKRALLNDLKSLIKPDTKNEVIRMTINKLEDLETAEKFFGG